LPTLRVCESLAGSLLAPAPALSAAQAASVRSTLAFHPSLLPRVWALTAALLRVPADAVANPVGAAQVDWDRPELRGGAAAVRTLESQRTHPAVELRVARV
jgi:hypothetical protein